MHCTLKEAIFVSESGGRSRSLEASIKDGAANALKLGSGDAYINPFAIFLKATPVQLGLTTSLAPFIGAAAQGLGIIISEKFKSRRLFISTCTAIESLFWIPIALLPFIFGQSELSVWILIVCLVLSQVAAGLSVPIWSSLIGELVPASIRGRFFGKRSRISGLATFLALAGAGQFLHFAEGGGFLKYGYLAIFLFAAASRLTSAYYLSCYDDPPYHVERRLRFSFLDFISRAHKSNFAKFVFFVSLMNASMMIAGPYFSAHMLSQLKFSYLDFTIISAALLAAQFATLDHWGALADKYGTKKLLSFCGAGVALIPFLWLFAVKPWHVVVVQVIGGICWAGFTLASTNFLFDAVSPPKRSRCAAYQAIINGSAMLIGSLIGGHLITHVGYMSDLGLKLSGGISPYPSLFLLSGVMRALTCIVFFSMFKEVREVEPVKGTEFIIEVFQIKPIVSRALSAVKRLRRGGRRSTSDS